MDGFTAADGNEIAKMVAGEAELVRRGIQNQA